MRRIVGNTRNGFPQIATEMAAPYGIENTNRHRSVKLQSECGWKRGDNGAEDNQPVQRHLQA